MIEETEDGEEDQIIEEEALDQPKKEEEKSKFRSSVSKLPINGGGWAVLEG